MASLGRRAFHEYESPDAVRLSLGANCFEPFSSDPGIRKAEVADDDQNVMKLAGGRIDAFLANEPTGDYFVGNPVSCRA
jgi:hypothetical protein